MAYDANSIELKDFASACRSTPGMYLGADREAGIFNCFLEIFNNACDEAIMGRGDLIEIELDSDCNGVTVIDHGAGVPHGPNKECQEILIPLFTSAHSSGKFNKKNYNKVRGLHGIGSSAVCVCSEFFSVVTSREGFEWKIDFNKGVPTKQQAEKINPTDKTGTKIYFKPDKAVFHLTDSDASFNYNQIKNELELTSYFIPNIKFVLIQNNKIVTFFSKNGLKDFARAQIKKPIHPNFIYKYEKFSDDVEIEVFAQWTNEREKSFVFSNGALNAEGGTPVTGAKRAITRTINKLANTSFTGDMIRKGLVYIINIHHPNPIYENQVKSKINNMELDGYTQSVFTDAIKEFNYKNKEEFDKIIEMLSKEQKAEVAAEKARLQVLNASKTIERNQKKKTFSSDKLKDAEFLGDQSILLIAEGNSALGGLAQGRDPKKYGIMAIRGKILNCLSHTEDKIYENEEIKLLLSALNIVPNKYNSKKLRYGKLAIAVDADRKYCP